MKKIFSLIIICCIAASALASCELIRKYEPPAEIKTEEKDTADSADNSGRDTDFPSSPEDTSPDENEKRYTEEEAYELLMDSFTDEEKELITVSRTGDMTAQSSGAEYYIFNAEKKAADADADADAEGPEKFNYYVSTNATILMSLEEDNATVSAAKKIFTDKNGESDSSGKPYVIKYMGVIKNVNEYCYNFEVYAGEGDTAVYKTNFLVSLDGLSYGEQVMK